MGFRKSREEIPKGEEDGSGQTGRGQTQHEARRGETPSKKNKVALRVGKRSWERGIDREQWTKKGKIQQKTEGG